MTEISISHFFKKKEEDIYHPMWNVKSVISCACHDFVAFGFFMSGLNRLDVLTSHDVDDGDQCLLTWHSKICLKDVSDLCVAHYLSCAP